ncbi:MAG: LamG-like jellyroll fold domain-containing protein [Paludibacter sp.]
MKKIFIIIMTLSVAIILFNSCQEMNRPAFGDYKMDSNPVGGPLKFYVAFDGTTDNPLMNAVDSIRANFATANTTTSINGINGKGIQGAVGKFVTYAKQNDFASTMGSFTVSFWEKHDGQTKNNALTNGPEYPFSFVAVADYHWSNSNFMLMFEGSNTACAVKMVVADGLSADGKASAADTWLTWEGAGSIAGLLDNQWHHCAFVYDQNTSALTFYKDGVSLGAKTWPTHGAIKLVDAKIASVRIGCGPQGDAQDVSEDWLRSTWKGGLDQFRLYSTALTAAEVSALFTKKM